jgi:hypothetical protein
MKTYLIQLKMLVKMNNPKIAQNLRLKQPFYTK